MPLGELGNLLDGFEAAYQREKKVAEQKAWDALTPEKQARQLSIIRQLEAMELGDVGKPHGG